MAYTGKTNWQNNEVVEASDMNRIEQGITNNDAGLTTHTALTTAHSAVATPTANRLMLRDANGRAQVATPTVAADIARLDTVTTHAAQSAAGTHGSAVTATPNTLIHRDANGRAQVAAPAVAADIARLDTVTAHTVLANTAHGAVSTPTINTLMARDASGRAQVAAPSVAADIARLDTVTGYAVNRAGDTMTGTLIAPNVLWGTNNSRGILLMNGTNLNDIVVSGWYDGDNLLNRPAGTLWGHVMVSTSGLSHLWVMQIFFSLYNENDYFIRRSFNGGGDIRVWTPWRRIWHEGNDGIGSGLDAGLLEGYNGASYGKWVAIGNTIMLEALTERFTSSQSMTMIKSFETSRPGQFRVTGEIACFNTESGDAIVELRNNAGNTISARFITFSTTFVNFTLDTNIFFPRMLNIINLFYANAVTRNVRLRGDDSPGTPTRVLLD